MDALDQLPVAKPLALIGTFAILSLIYFIGNAVYSIYFGPLSHIPGPKLAAISRLPYLNALLNGTTVKSITALHEKYGEVVRISPNEVSFISAETAWSDIYGFRTGKLKNHANMQKDPAWYPPPFNGAPSILTADDESHARGRRVLSHAFSERALAAQEGLLQKYVDQLVDRLREVTSSNDEPVNIVAWFNWIAFDIISDLIFGEAFGSLRDLATHKYIDLLLDSVKAFRFFYVMKYFPFVKHLGSLIVNSKQLAGRAEYGKFIVAQTSKRMAQETDRPDFMTHILSHNGDKPESALSEKEIQSNCGLFMTAGSETTATVLSGAIYLLCKNPPLYQKLKDEVRGLWKNYDEVTLIAVNSQAPYLIAVLQETLRYMPPVPTGFERRVGKGGEVVSGYYMPENISLSVNQYPAYHSERHFKDANTFIPERWLGDPKYADDKRSIMQPFSVGPRNCLGKNLAYAEMRLILAKLVWAFDFELDAKSANWMENLKVETLWAKPELALHVKEVVRA